jgi:hypothetical protein
LILASLIWTGVRGDDDDDGGGGEHDDYDASRLSSSAHSLDCKWSCSILAGLSNFVLK